MQGLVKYIQDYGLRGECQCGKCIDKQEDRPAPTHSASVHFFWVSAREGATKEGLLEVLKEYPDQKRLAGGPSYLELGGVLGDQGLALMLIGLGEVLGVWKVVTPKTFGMTGEQANAMAGNGMIMAGGFKGGE